MRTIFKHNNTIILEYGGPACDVDEMQATKELLAYEKRIDINDIYVTIPLSAANKSPLVTIDKTKTVKSAMDH